MAGRTHSPAVQQSLTPRHVLGHREQHTCRRMRGFPKAACVLLTPVVAKADKTAFHFYTQPPETAVSILLPHHSALRPPHPSGNTRGRRLAPPGPTGSPRSPGPARPRHGQKLPRSIAALWLCSWPKNTAAEARTTPAAFFLRVRSPPHSPRNAPAPPRDGSPPPHPRTSARLHHPGKLPGRVAVGAPVPSLPSPAAPAGPPPPPRVPPSSRCGSERKRKWQRQSGSGNDETRDSAPGRRGGPRESGPRRGRGDVMQHGMQETRAGEDPRVCRTVALFENPARSEGPPPSARGFNGCCGPTALQCTAAVTVRPAGSRFPCSTCVRHAALGPRSPHARPPHTQAAAPFLHRRLLPSRC